MEGGTPGAHSSRVLQSKDKSTGSKREELGQAISLESLLIVIAEAKRQGRRIVFTNGCFDLLHPGHIRCLEQARSLGDLLIVGINSDSSVKQLKGTDRPIICESERAEVLTALSAVDYVVIFDEPTPRELIARILPHILVKGGDWGPSEIVGREEVEAAGGRVVSVEVEAGYSTSTILEKIRSFPSSSVSPATR